MEKNKCISEKKCSITDFNQNLSVPDENMINKSDEIIVKDHSNTVIRHKIKNHIIPKPFTTIES